MIGEPSADIPRIAIVGMAGRYPDARNLDEFWQNLRDGRESIRFYSNQELLEEGVDPAWLGNPSFVPARPNLDGRDEFDAAFFGYSAQEAEIIDPQQRLFLEVAWEALENAGYVPGTYEGLIGVYAGASQNTYLWFNLLARPGFFQRHGVLRAIITNGADYLASRAAYKLNLRGPALTVQTACSTSLVALHLACQGLLNFECDMAMAGGASLRVTPIVGYVYEPGGLLSRDGHCRAFDASASGTVFGDGVGIVVLKRLEDAVRDGDTIHAVVLGSAVNNDGSQKAGFTAPSPVGQSAVAFQALEAANISADSISYVEAHGTGTELGDPIEIDALTKAFRASTTRRGFCAIGSVKSNVGHLDAAAGVTGVIKTVLAMKHGELPPSLHFDRPNPGITFHETPFFVNARLREWEGERPRRAGVHAFGMGGTNAFAVLEEAPAPRAGSPGRAAQLFLLSARAEKPLADASARLARLCREQPEIDVADAAYTLSVGRHPFQHRLAVVARSAGEAATRLESRAPGASVVGVARGKDVPVAFLFPGQGAQHLGMGRDLYTQEPWFRGRFDELCAALQAETGWDLRTLLYPDADTIDAAAARLRDGEVGEPALFAIELALAELWLRWGVVPRAMLGHGTGEYVAATLAGVFSWQDAVRLAAARGRLLQDPVPDDHVVAPYAAQAASAARQAPGGRWVSSLTGTWTTVAEAADPAYWVQQLRGPVGSAGGIDTVLAEGDVVLLTVGPGAESTRLMPPAGRSLQTLASLPDAGSPADGLDTALLTLGQLWTQGVAVDWNAFWRDERRVRVALPTYPFERQRYWLDVVNTAEGDAAPAAPIAELSNDTATAASHIDTWFSVPVWKQSAHWPRAARTGHAWLVILDHDGFGRVIAGELRSQGADVITAEWGPGFAAPSPDAFALRLDEQADYAALLGRLGEQGRFPDRVICCAAVRVQPGGSPDLLRDAFFVPLALSQALAAAPPTSLQIAIVTANAFEVIGRDGTRPEGALATGIARVVARELPRLAVRVIDLDLSHLPRDAWHESARAVAGEPDIEENATVVAHRNGRRWVQVTEPARFDAASAEGPFRPGGTYVITGGSGGIGLVVARALAGACRAKLALISRSGVDPADLAELEAAGGTVRSLAADIADPAACEAALARVRAEFGRIDGVIHAAGIAGGGLVAFKGRAAAEAVLAPKVAGTRALLAALDDDFPEMLVLFSSTAAFTGDVGQVDYAAASAYLDAVAQGQSSRGRRVLSINWDAWRDIGMAAATPLPASVRAQRAAILARAIPPDLGVEALSRAVSGQVPQVIVSPAGLETLAAEAELAQRMLASAAAPPVAAHARPDLTAAYVPPRTEDERRLIAAWEDLLGVTGIGVHDNFFELGGDSLLATALIARLRAATGWDYSLRDVLERPTVAEFAGRAADVQALARADDEARLLDELASLSEEEVAERLRALRGGEDMTSVR